MGPRIRGSDVYVVEDIERILSALAGASRRYGGDYGAGYQDALRDLAAAVGVTVDAPQLVERVHEVVEYRAERTVERYQTMPERSQAQPAQVAQRAPVGVNMTPDDCEVAVFPPGHGQLHTLKHGHEWIGADGSTYWWGAAEWQRVDPDEARDWMLLPDDWQVLCRHGYVARMRRQVAQSVRVLDNPRRRLLR